MKALFFFILLVFTAHSWAATNQISKISNNDTYSVAVIGDSQSSTPLGAMLVDDISKVGDSSLGDSRAEVRLYSVAGSSPRHWGNQSGKMKRWLCSRKTRFINDGKLIDGKLAKQCGNSSSVFENIVNQTSPQLVVFQFLGNSVYLRKSPSELKRNIQRMLIQVPLGAGCVWITSPPSEIDSSNPPRLETQELIADILNDSKSELGIECLIVRGVTEDSLNLFTNNRSLFTDKYHLSRKGAMDFMALIRSELELAILNAIK